MAQSDVMLSVRIHFISFSVRWRMKMTQMSRTKKQNWKMLFLCFQCAKLDFKHVEKSSWIRSRRRICCCDAGLMIFHSLVYFLPVALALLGDGGLWEGGWGAFHQILGYSLVPIRRHGSINRHTSFIRPYTFPKIWGVTINWINMLSKRGMTFIWIVLLSNKIKSKI